MITREQLFLALTTSYLHGWRLGDAVVVLGYASPASVEAEAEILELRRRAWADRAARPDRWSCSRTTAPTHVTVPD